MNLKTIMKLAIRSLAIVAMYNGFISTVKLMSFLFLNEDAMQMNLDTFYIELGRAVLGLMFGAVLFRFADRLTAVFGKDYDFDQKLEVVNPTSMIAAIYAIFGVWLVAFSVPDLLEEIIRLQTSYYGAAVNDLQTTIHKYSIVGDFSRLIIGVVLIKFRDSLPPLNRETPAGSTH